MAITYSPRLPTVRQLRYFSALAKLQHFGQAAAACNVSQSAFSAAIQEFENQLGVRLVDRTRRSVTVTALGHEVANQARACLQSLEALVELVASVMLKPIPVQQTTPMTMTTPASWTVSLVHGASCSVSSVHKMNLGLGRMTPAL